MDSEEKKIQEFWHYTYSSTEFCWGVPRQREMWLLQLHVPRPSHSKAEQVFPTGTYRATHKMQCIYGYMQTHMASHIDSQRQKHTNATTTNILFPAPGENMDS